MGVVSLLLGVCGECALVWGVEVCSSGSKRCDTGRACFSDGNGYSLFTILNDGFQGQSQDRGGKCWFRLQETVKNASGLQCWAKLHARLPSFALALYVIVQGLLIFAMLILPSDFIICVLRV